MISHAASRHSAHSLSQVHLDGGTVGALMAISLIVVLALLGLSSADPTQGTGDVSRIGLALRDGWALAP